MSDNPPGRICTTCLEAKPVTEYGVSKRRGDRVWFRKVCRACRAVEARGVYVEVRGADTPITPASGCRICGAACEPLDECAFPAGCAARASKRLVSIRPTWEWRDGVINRAQRSEGVGIVGGVDVFDTRGVGDSVDVDREVSDFHSRGPE